MGRKITTLNLNESDIEIAKRMGINLSALVRKAVRAAVEHRFDDLELGIRLSSIEERLASIDGEINILNNRLNNLNREKELLIAKADQIRKELTLSENAARLADLMQTLNNYLLTNDFDTSTVPENLLSEIQEILPDFDLEAHITKLRTILDI